MKTMMKRSLALGALMAFVITGSAFAEDVVHEGDYANKNLQVTGTDNITVNNGFYGVAGKVEANSLTITNDKKDGDGIIAYGSLDIKLAGDLDINSKANCIFVGTNQNGVTADTVINISAKNIYLTGRSWGLAPKAGQLNVTAEQDIVINTANGITNTSGSPAVVKAQNIKVTTDSSYGVYAGNGTLTLDIAKDVVIDHKGTNDEQYGAVQATGENAKLVIKNEGNTVVNGNVIAGKGKWSPVDGKGGSVDISFKGEGSSLTGAVITNNSGNSAIELSGGASWNVTGDSEVSTLTGDKANIILSDDKTTVNVVDNKNTGVNVQSTGALSDANAKDIQGMMDKLAGNVTLGGVTDKTVTAGEGLIVGETSAKYEGENMVDGSLKEKENTVNGAISDAGAIGLMTWRNEMNDMNKRMGELRGNEAEHGVWVRMINGELEYEGLENDTKSYQLGYDEKLSTDPRWTVGVSLNYTEGDTSGDKVSAENDHKGFAVYGSKLNEDGGYLDLIAKYARLDHEFTVRGGDKGEWNANGYSVSAEYGKRFTQESGLWYEPQIELTYGRVGAADYKVGGRFVEQDKMDSLVGRVGFRVGKDTAKGNVYARASYLYDFDGETSVTFSDGRDAVRTIEQDLGGGWVEVGIGANYKLSDATNLYIDVEKAFGGEVDVNWQWNAGVRYSF